MSLLPLPRPCASSRRRILCSICSITARASPSRSFTSPSSSFTDKAVFVSPEHGAHIRRLSRPSESDISQKQNALEPDEVLIENVAVASNPKGARSPAARSHRIKNGTRALTLTFCIVSSLSTVQIGKVHPCGQVWKVTTSPAEYSQSAPLSSPPFQISSQANV